MSAWPIPKLFPGQTVAVIAGGPSATPEAIASVRHYPRIAVRNSYALVDQPEVVLSLDGDADWFAKVPPYSTQITGNPDAASDIVHYIGLGYYRFHVDANTEKDTRNSGLRAILVAAEMGASEILLVGFDPEIPGYAPGYEAGVQQSGRPYGDMAIALKAITAELAAKGVAVRRAEIAALPARIAPTANDQPVDVPMHQPEPAEAASEESERPARRRRERFTELPAEPSDG